MIHVTSETRGGGGLVCADCNPPPSAPHSTPTHDAMTVVLPPAVVH